MIGKFSLRQFRFLIFPTVILVGCLKTLSGCSGFSAQNSGSASGNTPTTGSPTAGTLQLGESGLFSTSSGVATDSSQNFYVVGNTEGNLISCHGVSATCSGSAQGSLDYFISKYNSAGVWQWTQQLGQTNKFAAGYAMAVDSNGDVYVGGSTTGNLVSCGGLSANCSGSSNSVNATDYFISKYNTAGVWQWTRQLGYSGVFTQGTGIALDSSHNVYVSGATGANLSSCGGVPANCSGTSQGLTDSYISKYDTSGTWQWTRQLGESGRDSSAYALKIDSGDNAYVMGYTNGNLVSCGGVSASCTGASKGSYDYFISKYNSAGVWQWTQQLGQTGTMTYVDADGTGGGPVAIDSSNNVYVAGYTTGNLVSCGGVSASCSGSSQGTEDSFVSKYNSAGIWQWTQQLGETGVKTSGYELTTDSTNSVYVAGFTAGNLVSCGGVSATCSGASAGAEDAFVSKYSAAGTWQWTRQLGEAGKATHAYGVATDVGGVLYFAGWTTGLLTSCNGISANCSGSSRGTKDYFTARYSTSGSFNSF